MERPMSFEAFFIPMSISSPSNLVSGLFRCICIDFRDFSAVHFYDCVSHFRDIQVVRHHYDREIIFLLKSTDIVENLPPCLFVQCACGQY